MTVPRTDLALEAADDLAARAKKFSLPEEFFILQDFLSLRLLFCCRMCYTIIGLQRQYAVIFIECMISKI